MSRQSAWIDQLYNEQLSLYLFKQFYYRFALFVTQEGSPDPSKRPKAVKHLKVVKAKFVRAEK